MNGYRTPTLPVQFGRLVYDDTEIHQAELAIPLITWLRREKGMSFSDAVAEFRRRFPHVTDEVFS